MAMDETIIYIYDEPQYNNIQTRCEHCLTKSVLFFAEEQFLQFGYPIVHSSEADHTIRHIWAQLNDPDNLPEDENSPDKIMDGIVERNFHDWLEAVSPDDFG